MQVKQMWQVFPLQPKHETTASKVRVDWEEVAVVFVDACFRPSLAVVFALPVACFFLANSVACFKSPVVSVAIIVAVALAFASAMLFSTESLESELNLVPVLFESLSQPISAMLDSPHPLIRALAVMDARCGRRRLRQLDPTDEHPLVIRALAPI